MELQHDGPRGEAMAERTVIAGSPARGVDHPPVEPAAPLLPEPTTAALRRCTALATRARADLLTHGRQTAAVELAELLEEMAGWTPDALVDPDPTMTVLAAAALQDLAARLPSPAPSDLDLRIDAAVSLLGAVMEQGRVGASA